MRITFAMSSTGIFYSPGLAQPVVLDLSALPPAEAARIEALVRDAHVLDRPAAPEGAPVPDARRFTVTIDEDGRSRTLELAEPIADPALKALIRCLQDQVRALRAKKRP
ncbi:protealysin inhibitor emfourin [Inquilinus limosus]|uniref:protealysin inhibitor emfourin n=1 Tax=Inquilinus limosus TaxID=171674 RepID=UPI000424CA22|nr:protealysin inhibitor emfourin [Inquilinus limosus]